MYPENGGLSSSPVLQEVRHQKKKESLMMYQKMKKVAKLRVSTASSQVKRVELNCIRRMEDYLPV